MGDLELVNVSYEGDRTTVRLAGRLVVTTVPDARRGLDTALGHGHPIVMDGAGLIGVDTAGLQLLAMFCTVARERGLALQWRQVSPALRDGAATLALGALLQFGEPIDVHH